MFRRRNAEKNKGATMKKKNNIATMQKLPVLALALAGVLALSACSNMREQLGMGRHSPDEFTVVKRAPLTLPPEYALRPPSADNLPPASETSKAARTVLMGEKQDVAPATADEAFLAKAGAQDADSSIRSQINRDNGYIALQNRSLADRLIFWGDSANGELPASVVDPKAEAERVKKNLDEGKPVNQGDVPVIEKKKSTIEKIF